MSAATNTLTRTDQVLAVLRAGGRAVQGNGGESGIWSLYDASGKQLNAWSFAIREAHRIHTQMRTQQRKPQ